MVRTDDLSTKWIPKSLSLSLTLIGCIVSWCSISSEATETDNINHLGSVSLCCMVIMPWANLLVIQSISAVSKTGEAVSPLDIQEWRGLLHPLSLNRTSHLLLHKQLLETNVKYPQGTYPLFTLRHRWMKDFVPVIVSGYVFFGGWSEDRCFWDTWEALNAI